MSEVTRILSELELGDPATAERLLPLVYEELRALASQKLAREAPGQTLQATALVHEAFLRISQGSDSTSWRSRAHFFAAAAEAMRRILVDNARRKQALKRGGGGQRLSLEEVNIGFDSHAEEVLAIDDALSRLAEEDPQAARLIQLRFFGGLSIEEAAEAVGVSRSSAYEHWAYARVRLKTLLDDA